MESQAVTLKIIEMARLGEVMIADAMLALSERREDFSEKMFRSEKQMNALEMEVDETLLTILSIEERGNRRSLFHSCCSAISRPLNVLATML